MADFPDWEKLPGLKRYIIKENQWKNGIILRMPNWLGDSLMALPALLQIKKIIPENKKLFVICPPGLKGLFESLKAVDKVIALEAAHKAWTSNDIKKVEELGAGAALLFNNSLRDAFYMRLAKVPKLFGSSMRGRWIFLSGSWKIPKMKKGRLNKFHHAAKYLSMAYALGAPEWDGTLPEFRKVEDLEEEVKKTLRSEKLLSIAPGAAYGEAKRWPAENFRKVCEDWLKKGGDVAVLGTSGETAVAEKAVEGLPVEKVSNLCGKTSLPELIEILKKTRICVANDSGVMHLGAITGCEGVAIFGSTDPSSTFPVSRKWKVFYEQQKCSPCFKRECPKDTNRYACMKVITPEKVIEYISKKRREML